MRIYEFAKRVNMSNKDILDLLDKNGFQFKTHMSALTPESMSFLEKHFSAPKKAQGSPPVNASKRAPAGKEGSSTISSPKKENAPFVVRSMALGDLACRLSRPPSELILTLLRDGVMCAKNEFLSEQAVEKLLTSYDVPFEYPGAEKIDINKKDGFLLKSGSFERDPVVVVLGHVDHGKTTLLDFVRKTRVVQKEKGGITQHLGAYSAQTNHGNIVFIDTPGHQAFSNIRGRGVKIADIAILVVAADDSVMPQTVEAIKKIKEAEIPVIVAVNKIDKAEKSQLEKVKTDLSRHDLLPEEWGGDTVLAPISAKDGTGVDHLLEIVALQGQMLELRADIDAAPRGFVLETKIEKGRGSVATVICLYGYLRVGDYFVAGSVVGRVSSLVNSYGKSVQKIGPSEPVLVSGFSALAQAGDYFEVVTQEAYKKVRSSKNPQSAFRYKNEAGDALKIILKADTTSTLEALSDSITRLSGKKTQRKIQVVFAGIGDIAESDVSLAENTGAKVFGLHTKMQAHVSGFAQEGNIGVFQFDIIYKLIERLEEFIQKPAEPVYEFKKIGEAVVKKVFNIKGLGVIAGSYVTDGRFARQGHVKAFRGNDLVGEGPIKSLERDRKSVKEVHSGFEFAFLVNDFNDWNIDDRVECYLKELVEE